jgi:Tfp pilus assembly protein PilF
MKQKIKIDFSDFPADFNKESNFFYDLLSRRYDIEITDDPDFLIYSPFGRDFFKYQCIRIFYASENIRPDFNECDYAFSFDYADNNKRNYRLPFYVVACDTSSLTNPKPDPEPIMRGKTKFCNMVVSLPVRNERIDFFYKLSKYKKVDSGGRFLNNIGGPVRDKMEFIKDYKFSICFENSSYPGYTTEKIVHAMLVHSIPVYWGNPLIHKDFNTKSFINCHDYSNFDEVVERIIEIDNDVELYKEYLRQPYFVDNLPNEFVDKGRILEQFHFIFSNRDKIVPVYQMEKITGQALLHYQSGDLRRAADLFKDVLQNQPDNAKVLYLLGLTYGKLKDHQSAMQYLVKSLERDPGNADIYRSLGTILEDLGMSGEASGCFQKAADIDSKNTEKNNNLIKYLKEKDTLL